MSESETEAVVVAKIVEDRIAGREDSEQTDFVCICHSEV